MWILVLQRIALEFIFDLVYFPLWWHTKGMKRAFLFCLRFLQDGNIRLSPWLWLKNMFVPMYGQQDIGGRLVSVFMRLVNFVGRSGALLIWSIIIFTFFFAWLLLPVFAAYMLVRSLS